MTAPQASINVPHMAPAESIFKLKFHQVAIYCWNPLLQVQWWEDNGFGDWHFDQALLVGQDRGVQVSKKATMAFNYDIMPLELEYVSYHGPRNSVDERSGSVPFLSHLSTIVEDVDDEMGRIEKETGLRPYHQFVTEGHTNPKVKFKKRFKEAIYDTRFVLGFDIKLIQRVPWDYGN